jgi:hypothetical protein
MGRDINLMRIHEFWPIYPVNLGVFVDESNESARGFRGFDIQFEKFQRGLSKRRLRYSLDLRGSRFFLEPIKNDSS